MKVFLARIRQPTPRTMLCRCSRSVRFHEPPERAKGHVERFNPQLKNLGRLLEFIRTQSVRTIPCSISPHSPCSIYRSFAHVAHHFPLPRGDNMLGFYSF